MKEVVRRLGPCDVLITSWCLEQPYSLVTYPVFPIEGAIQPLTRPITEIQGDQNLHLKILNNITGKRKMTILSNLLKNFSVWYILMHSVQNAMVIWAVVSNLFPTSF